MSSPLFCSIVPSFLEKYYDFILQTTFTTKPVPVNSNFGIFCQTKTFNLHPMTKTVCKIHVDFTTI